MVTLPVTMVTPNPQPPQSIFYVTFHIFVVGEHRDFKFGVRFNHSKLQPTDDKLSLKRAWSRSRDLFKFWEIINDISEMVQDSLNVLQQETK